MSHLWMRLTCGPQARHEKHMKVMANFLCEIGRHEMPFPMQFAREGFFLPAVGGMTMKDRPPESEQPPPGRPGSSSDGAPPPAVGGASSSAQPAVLSPPPAPKAALPPASPPQTAAAVGATEADTSTAPSGAAVAKVPAPAEPAVPPPPPPGAAPAGVPEPPAVPSQDALGAALAAPTVERAAVGANDGEESPFVTDSLPGTAKQVHFSAAPDQAAVAAAPAPAMPPQPAREPPGAPPAASAPAAAPPQAPPPAAVGAEEPAPAAEGADRDEPPDENEPGRETRQQRRERLLAIGRSTTEPGSQQRWWHHRSQGESDVYSMAAVGAEGYERPQWHLDMDFSDYLNTNIPEVAEVVNERSFGWDGWRKKTGVLATGSSE